ncbi:hypothetical protein ACSBM8_15880 [Sphingomonas sp. ASY06-1R]|uniref:hypothetical protein n=1 Tax=Sphingomonas sp. ASY06-1R TaxID=3445771 RepID=UPI003FA1DD8B
MVDSRFAEVADTCRAQDAAIERLLRRSLLALARNQTTVQDRHDFADLADALGEARMASLVRSTARLREGFGALDSRNVTPGDSVTRAVAELTVAIARCKPDPVTSPAATSDPVAACHSFADLLSQQPTAEASLALASLLATWRDLVDGPPPNISGRVNGTLGELVDGYAAYELQTFLRSNQVLAFAPHGSVSLLQFAACLSPGGLGPYFSAVSNIVRGGQDVLGLIALASGGEATQQIERWVAVLSNRLPEHITVELADILADLGRLEPLRALLDAAANRSDRDAVMRHIRDAALDLGDHQTAMRAQKLILTRTPYDVVERRRVGAMLAACGDAPAAEAALADTLRRAPSDAETIAQLEALRSGDFTQFAVNGGSTTPPARKRIRFSRRLTD